MSVWRQVTMCSWLGCGWSLRCWSRRFWCFCCICCLAIAWLSEGSRSALTAWIHTDRVWWAVQFPAVGPNTGLIGRARRCEVAVGLEFTLPASWAANSLAVWWPSKGVRRAWNITVIRVASDCSSWASYVSAGCIAFGVSSDLTMWAGLVSAIGLVFSD